MARNCLLFSLLIFLLYIQSANAATIFVNASNSGPQDGFTANTGWQTIQAGINNAIDGAGDTVQVLAGTYNENVDVNKSVNLVGYGFATTTVSANNINDHVLNVSSSSVNISGFTLTGATGGFFPPMAGVNLYFVNNCNISDNKITGNNQGIRIDNSNNNLITGNNITGQTGAFFGFGIETSSAQFNLIYNNYFSNNPSGNARDFFTTNDWNTSYQAGSNILGGPYLSGNYWSDYTGVDDGSGIYPNNISYDGIGDTNLPYVNIGLGFGGVDNLPLTIPDLTSPVIFNIKNVTISDISTVIVWETDEDSNSLVRYNTSAGSYKFSEAVDSFTKLHRMMLTNLTPNTVYYYIVNSTDPSGNSNQSVEFSFTTGNLSTVCVPSGCDYTTIQEAINNLSSNNRVFVFNGTYSENVVLNKSLTLEGQNKDTTVIDCGKDICLNIAAEGANITGFTVQNGTHGIFVDNSNYTIVEDNIVKDNRYDGISLNSSYRSRVVNNKAVNNQLYYGIGVRSSENTYIENNNASSNFFGIYITKSCGITVKDSLTNDNTYYGIYLSSASCSYLPHSNHIIYNTFSRNYFGLLTVNIDSINISYNNFIQNSYQGYQLINGSGSTMFLGPGTILGPSDDITTNPPGSRVIVDKKWESSDNNVTYNINIDNFGLIADTFNLNVTNVSGAALTMDQSAVTLNPGETITRTMTVGDGAVGDYKVIVEAISQNDSTVRDKVETMTIVTGSSNDSVIQNSNIPNSNIVDSAIYDSNITNSNITRSIINSSSITNTNLVDIELVNAVVSSGTISSGNITTGGITYEITATISITALIVGSDDEDSTLVGVSGTQLNVTAGNANAEFRIAAEGDYIGATMKVQRSTVQPIDANAQTNNVGGYSYVEPSKNLEASMNWTYIKIYYDQSEVDAKNIAESTLSLQFFNETSQAWETISPGGVDTTGNYVWANSTHFSVLGLKGDIKPTTVSTSTGGYTPTIIPSIYDTTLVVTSQADTGNLIRDLDYTSSPFYVAPPVLAGPLGALDMFVVTPDLVDSINEVAWKKVSTLEGDPYALASEYALAKYDTAPQVIIARGDLDVDSCAAVAYAQILNEPILIVKSDEIPPIIQSTLSQLGTNEVIILGGPVAVSEEVGGNLPDATRIGGEDRYETAVKIAEALMLVKVVDTVVITDGENPDMTSGMLAVHYGAPIVYTRGKEIPPDPMNFLEKHTFKRIILVGVPNEVEEKIKQLI